jgi:hypothetical protein
MAADAMSINPLSFMQMICTPEDTPDYATEENELMFEHDEHSLVRLVSKLCNMAEERFPCLTNDDKNDWFTIVHKTFLNKYLGIMQTFGLNVYEQELWNFIKYKEDPVLVAKCEKLLRMYYVFVITFHGVPFVYNKRDDEIIFTRDPTDEVYKQAEVTLKEIYRKVHILKSDDELDDDIKLRDKFKEAVYKHIRCAAKK